MKFLGILRASALFILLSAFHGPRGIFCGNLKVNPSTESSTVEVPEISEKPKESTVESSSELSAPPPKSNLVFESSKWHDSKLASAVLFLKQFCRKVKAKQFNGYITGIHYTVMKGICSNMSDHLKGLSKIFLPNDFPLNPYKDALEPEKFKDYVGWLKKNIPMIRKSLDRMLQESLLLTKDQWKENISIRPSKYGFVFNNKGINVFYKSNLNYATKKITAVLESLRIRIGKILNANTP
ncbi:secreted antigen 1 [Babesia divergens]|uniref:Secreted antigen 1 n=1 Tax=Babesia divergens TaxID=32595 RepID=A0AAD9LEM6_BABDI|nr:secreted antigen 1 [Babesia divergens]